MTGTQPRRAGSYPGYDPSYAIVYGAFSGAMNHYVRQELKFESDQPYEILSRAVHPWNYSRFSTAMWTPPVSSPPPSPKTPPCASSSAAVHRPGDPGARDRAQHQPPPDRRQPARQHHLPIL
ncbi:MAG: hypothetical protein R3F11_17810 [Verrucomicrobiales bacterium]